MDSPLHPAASAPPPPSSSQNSSFGVWLVLLIIAFGIGFWLGSSQPKTEPPAVVAAPTPTPQIVYVVVSPTPIQGWGGGSDPNMRRGRSSATVMPMPSPIPTSTQAAGAFSTADGMELMYVHGGDFDRGTNEFLINPAKESHTSADSMPLQTIAVAPFYIDKYEVTNAMYAKCVAAGECPLPLSTYHSDNHTYEYFSNPQYAASPVIFVTWFDAQAYCAWAGRRLPTEAEWEKAARGWDGWNYPWGNDPPTAELANFGNTLLPMSVDAYPAGASRYGAYNMAGNVAEWVADRYSKDYYPHSEHLNPTGPGMGDYRVFRGGSSYSNSTLLLTFWREAADEDIAFASVGFRCADSNPSR